MNGIVILEVRSNPTVAITCSTYPIMAFCFPSIQEVNSFKVPLEPGENHLLNFLIDYLDDRYEIYVQPFLNGDRPDIVVVRPDAGVLIIEVKDWNLKHYENLEGGLASWKLIENNVRIRSPLSQVESYKSNLYELHIQQLFERKINNKGYFSVVQTAVYFHNESTSEAKKFCHKVCYVHILGNDALNPQSFKRVLHKAHLDRPSRLFDQELYNSFKRFLKPPEHTPEMGRDIKYTRKQSELVKSKAGLRQKVRGVAGCGKTKVLAGRAVSAYARTRDIVLILTFNLTLRNYIHDQISQVRELFPWAAFEITNYHQFFKTQANNYGLEYGDLLKAADEKDFFASVKDKIQRYKTILVDEVQDYKNEWLRLLLEYFLAEDGEFVLFGDEKQNVYGRSMGNDKFPVTPIPGRWNELNESFRMGSTIFKIAQTFQKFYLRERYQIDENIEIVQGDLFETPEQFRYYQVSAEEEVLQLILNEIKNLNVHPNDLVVLTTTHEKLRSIEYDFRHTTNELTTHAGETKEEYERLLEKYGSSRSVELKIKFKIELEEIRRGRKLHFWGHAGTTKFSTIHSFKGWEAHTLMLVISDTEVIEEKGLLEELIYTGLTRTKKNLIVFNETGLYKDFFSKFER